MGKQIVLRTATLSDLEMLRHWDEQEHVLESDPNDDWDWEIELQRQPSWREQWIAEWNGRPLGFVQIIDPAKEESHYWGEIPDGFRAIDIWLGDSKDLGKGYGTKIMRLTIDRCFDDPRVSAILLDPLESNTRAHRFYERLGFRFLRKQRFDQDDCFIYRLSRDDWKPMIE